MIKKIIAFFKNIFRRKKAVDVFNDSRFSTTHTKKGNNIDVPHKLPKKISAPRFKKPCKLCGMPMFVSIGQTVYTHRSCRTDYRRKLRSKWA